MISVTLSAEVVLSLASKPLDYFSYEKVIPRGDASPNLWDYWLFSSTITMSLYGEPFVFSKSVGFIMGLEKNRLTSIWDRNEIDLQANIGSNY